MKTEADLFEWLKLNVCGHWQRIETTTSSGVPDVNRCYFGSESWLELKAPGKLVTSASEVPALLRPAQRGWLPLRAIHGGKCFVFVLSPYTSVTVFRVLRCSPIKVQFCGEVPLTSPAAPDELANLIH